MDKFDLACHVADSVMALDIAAKECPATFKGYLPNTLRDLGGYTTPKQRELLCHLCEIDDCSYLEVGVFYGASLFSAAFGNTGSFVGIDNFQERRGKESCKALQLQYPTVELIEADFWTMDLSVLRPVNVLFFDANTDNSRGSLALSRIPLTDAAIVIVDNWSYVGVRANFVLALQHHGWSMFSSVQLITGDDCDITDYGSGWLVAVIDKTKPVRSTRASDMEPIYPQDTPLWDIQERTVAGLLSIKDYVAAHEKMRQKK